MRSRRTPRALLVVAAISLSAATALAQPSTLLPRNVVDGIANTVSGARPLQNLTDLFGYEHDRLPAEYAGPLRETSFVAEKAREYGLSDVEVIPYEGGPEWDGSVGELWITSPVLRKVIDFRDISAALAPGSVTGTYEGPLVWIEDASDPEAFAGRDVTGAIVLTRASTRGAFTAATERGALGVVVMAAQRPYTMPETIQWSSIGQPEAGFAFNLPAIIVDDLRELQVRSDGVTVRAVVEAEWRRANNEVVTATIPGDGSSDEWVWYTAHLFEGIQKQGAADDGSGSVLILETGRALVEAMERGLVRRPARSIRFLWMDEFTGTYAFIEDRADEFSRVVADVNIDMAGQNVTLNNNATRLYRMPYSRIHFLGDVAQEFFEWVGTTNIERIHERGGGYKFSYPILDPYGTRDAWRYVVEPYYGSSDHVVFNDLGVPGVMFNHWPDMVYHTSHDRPAMMDATQMKRVAFIAAATGLVVAGSPDVSVPQVAAEAFGRGEARIAVDLRTWTRHLASLPAEELAAGYGAASAAISQWHAREVRNIRTVLQLTEGSTSSVPAVDAATIELLAAEMEARIAASARALDIAYEGLASRLRVSAERPGPTPAEVRAGSIVPRPTGSNARVRIRAEGLPGFTAMEARNFADGTRSLVEIRDAVNAEYALEYGPVTLEAVEAYLRQLADAGVLVLE
jgi:hypothetical protein